MHIIYIFNIADKQRALLLVGDNYRREIKLGIRLTYFEDKRENKWHQDFESLVIFDQR